jgi:hypothetical protein
MDIIIHGTKGGCKIFTPKRLSGLLDVTADGAKTASIGKQAYAIRFTADNTIFSKYKIIRDVRGDKRTGFVAFSLFLPNSKKLSGTDIITLLDNVSDEYCRKYIPDNNNLDEVREDWSFLDRISHEYESKLKPNDERMQSGSKDDAFVYFKDTDELKRYFDVPCQEEYSDNRQVLFVEEGLRGKPEDPLNALRHSDNNLTGKIDLENPKYKLLFKRQDGDGLNIKVRVKDTERSNGNKVRKKDVLNINYDQKFRKPFSIKGTWEDIKLKYSTCIKIDDEKETITINPIPLSKDKKIISITVIDALSKKMIPDCQVICRSNYDQFPQEVNNNQIVFEGDEIGNEWHIEIKSADYTSYKRDFKPEDTPKIQISLNKQKILTIEVIDERNNKIFSPNDYELKIFDNKKQTPQYQIENEKNKIVFVGNEIEKIWSIEVKKRDYEVSGEKAMICPQNKDTEQSIKIYVRKKRQTTINDSYKNGNRQSSNDNSTRKVSFKFEAGKHGKLIGDGKLHSEDSLPDHHNNKHIRKHYKIKIKPDFGYKFVKWTKSEHENKEYIFKAQFNPIIPVKFLLLGMMSMMGIIVIETVSFYLVLKEDNSREKIQCTSTEIMKDNTNNGSSGDVDSSSTSNSTSPGSNLENTTNESESIGSTN